MQWTRVGWGQRHQQLVSFGELGETFCNSALGWLGEGFN